MDTSKIAGIETEYGILLAGAEQSDPFAASRLLLMAYPHLEQHAPFVPYYDSALTQVLVELSATPSVPTDPEVDIMLANGARFYIDHAHPEYSTPECRSARELVAADKAGERILADCRYWQTRQGTLPDGQQLLLYKNNSDYKGNSYGCHENYLLSAALFAQLLDRNSALCASQVLPFLVTRMLFCGSGKVGAENGRETTGFQLTQRADFFETLMGLQTTHRRPLFNTRDEPHADRTRLRRLHVIAGDANMAEYSTYLKVGVTQLFLQMLEAHSLQEDLTLADPLQAAYSVSHDLTFQEPLLLKDGRRLSALDIQFIYLEQAWQDFEERGGDEEQQNILEEWEDVLNALSDNWSRLATRLDWAIKKRVLDRYLVLHKTTWEEILAWQPIIEASKRELAAAAARHANLKWDDYDRQHMLYFALRKMNLDYHNINYDPERGDVGLFYRLQQQGALKRLVTDAEIAHLMRSAPVDTRAWVRSQCITRFGAAMKMADWDEVHFKDPEKGLLPLPDPYRGTEADVAPFWSQIEGPAQLLEHQYFAAEKGDQGDG